jgi:hypothetical protein
MKSQLHDQEIKTNCKNCQCAIYEGNTQTSCTFDRIKGFGDSVIEAYDDEKEFYVIKRFCNYYRSPKWNDANLDLNKIKHESAISFDVIIVCDDLTEESDVNNLLDIVAQSNYYKDKINIALVHSSRVSTNVRKNILKVFMALKCNLTDAVDLNEFLHHFLGSSKATYHIVLNISNISILNELFKANAIINNELKTATLFNLHGVKIVSNIVYRIQSGISGESDYSKNMAQVISKSIESNTCVDIL